MKLWKQDLSAIFIITSTTDSIDIMFFYSSSYRLTSQFAVTCLLLPLIISACSLFDGKDGNTANSDFKANYEKWQSKNPSYYTFTIDRQCFCPRGNFPAKIEIEDDNIARVLDPDTGEPIPEDSLGTPSLTYSDVYPTINDLFELLEEAIDNNADRIDVSYNQRIGYPVKIYIDYSTSTVDEEISYEISSYRSVFIAF